MKREHEINGELPSEYKLVKCLKSTNNPNASKWIDTGFVPNQDTEMVLDVRVFKNKNNDFASRMAGCENIGANSGKFRIGGGGAGRWYTGYDGYPYQQVVNITEGRHTLEILKNVFKVDGQTIYTYNYTKFTGYSSIWLYMVHSDNMVDYASMDLYSCQIKDNGTLVRDYVPCYSISDMKPGLYDLVNGVFAPGQGVETLTWEE